ncbi:MAG: pyruvate ferredoxin oxidoreductase [Oscillospiraceae bacterium]|jgi:pyruvate ferredoxin oxidoreductase alpha subunit|nr:pyruvate ferredoxin oxidoreductase [Oscillospiraceae bacterium]
MRSFISGNDAAAAAVRLARPQVISAYPITPQTTVVERLAEFAEDGSLDAEFIHVESEHSALSAAMGASLAGVRTFTATSSQGLLYMAEVLSYAAGGRFPIVMVNANRSLALPWNIYGDQRDSLGLLDSGWIQAYAENAQEVLDLTLMAFRIAEDPAVRVPFMMNLDGFHLTHTYEVVEVPTAAQADEFLPAYDPGENQIDFEAPRSFGFSAGPEWNASFHRSHHEAMLRARAAVDRTESAFHTIFGRRYPGGTDAYRCGDAEYILVTLGSVSGLCRQVADALRENGVKAGILRLRYLRPFPDEAVHAALSSARAAAVLEKDISFGGAGTVFTNVRSAAPARLNVIGGLGGADISATQIAGIFERLQKGESGVKWL